MNTTMGVLTFKGSDKQKVNVEVTDASGKKMIFKNVRVAKMRTRAAKVPAAKLAAINAKRKANKKKK